MNDIVFLATTIHRNLTMYLDELHHELRARRSIFVSLQALLRTLCKLHYSHKSIPARALERQNHSYCRRPWLPYDYNKRIRSIGRCTLLSDLSCFASIGVQRGERRL
ncbi:hypothetical protein BDR07DRAFT_1435565 [Suillus spraguei]|nr:hypothetical protein BDR07DRAFT_1435565 [Suillus spraguei]